MRKSLILSFASLAPVAFVVLAACGGDDKPAPDNGVNSVKLSCEIRTQWQKKADQECINCLSISKTPKCDCPAFQQDYAAKCADQGAAVGNERACDFVGDCTSKCAANDCACVEACYNGRDACRPKADALDGCTTDVCDKYCR